MKYKVIDNFLDKECFDSLVALFTNKVKTEKQKLSWYFITDISDYNVVEDNLFYMMHTFYESNMPTSFHYNTLIPLLEKLKVECLIRIKSNLYPNTEILHEHPMHADLPYSHSAAILSLNTCDGYTKLKDGTKIDSVANRILFFDPSEEHCSTTTTNDLARFNININYLTQRFLISYNDNQ